MDPRHFFLNFFFVHARLVLPINNNNKSIHCWLTFTHYAFVLDIAPVEISRHTHTGACPLDSYASRSLSFHPTFALSSKVNDPSPSTFYSCAMQIERQLINYQSDNYPCWDFHDRSLFGPVLEKTRTPRTLFYRVSSGQDWICSCHGQGLQRDAVTT